MVEDPNHTITISSTEGGSTAKETDRNGYKDPNKGSGTNVKINLNDNGTTKAKNSNGKTKKEKIPTNIALAHELIHAEHNRTGTSADKSVREILENNFRSGASGESHFLDPEEAFTVGEAVKVYKNKKEYNTGRQGNGITENAIRKEQGLSERVDY